MIVVTGGAGFIGSNLVARLTGVYEARREVAVIDWLGSDQKWRNLASSALSHLIPPEESLEFLNHHARATTAVVHLGAISSTTVTDGDAVAKWNIHSSLSLADWCYERGIKFLYASSAATYGDGSQGFVARTDLEYLRKLRPLNLYGWSKHCVDLALARRGRFAADALAVTLGLKFFNLYGANEYHKGSQQSTVAHFYRQIRDTGRANLFKSYRPDFQHGEQLRDFVAVTDCVNQIVKIIDHGQMSGIANLGTGKARSFNDLARAVFAALNLPPQLDYVDMPESLRDKYQYFTQAGDLIDDGYPYASLEVGVRNYVRDHLSKDNPYL
ncbi:MAG: ADP-glyceromanno-heptose 6-epimerase [Alphaproteobacteria bacterium]|nr:ADP-glyceromanno-heptose 6-epimerase [Alphaproteobacteria bacterium]